MQLQLHALYGHHPVHAISTSCWPKFIGTVWIKLQFPKMLVDQKTLLNLQIMWVASTIWPLAARERLTKTINWKHWKHGLTPQSWKLISLQGKILFQRKEVERAMAGLAVFLGRLLILLCTVFLCGLFTSFQPFLFSFPKFHSKRQQSEKSVELVVCDCWPKGRVSHPPAQRRKVGPSADSLKPFLPPPTLFPDNCPTWMENLCAGISRSTILKIPHTYIGRKPFHRWNPNQWIWKYVACRNGNRKQCWRGTRILNVVGNI